MLLQAANYKDLNDGLRLKTLDGKVVPVTVEDNCVSIDGATIQDRDVKNIKRDHSFRK